MDRITSINKIEKLDYFDDDPLTVFNENPTGINQYEQSNIKECCHENYSNN